MGILAASGYSEKLEDSYAAGQEVAASILAKIELKRKAVGILFCGISFDLEKLLGGIREKLDIPIVGCTTWSEATDEGYFEESASLMVLTSDGLEVGIGVGEDLSADLKGAVNGAWDRARAALGQEPKLAITFPDAALTASAESVLEILQSRARGVPIVGGLPGDGGKFKKTFQVVDGKVLSDSIPVLLLGGDINPVVVTRSGWIPIGKKATATKVDGTRLLEIDGQPAIEYLKRYISNIDDPEILGTYPIALLDSALGLESGKYFVIRSPFSYEKETGAVVYAGNVPSGGAIQLARGSREDILAGAAEAVDLLVKTTGDQKPGAVLFFSCAARKLMLGLSTEKEVDQLKQKLGPTVPIAGFYAYGEIGPIDSTDERLKDPRFHNCTIVLCAL